MAKIVGDLKARLGLDKSGFDKGIDGAEKKTSKFSAGIKRLGGALAAAFAVTKIVALGKALLGITDIQAKAEQGLLVALKGRRDIQQSLIKQSQDLQKVTLFGDEQTIEGAAKLAMLLGQDEEAISKLLPLVQDLATAKFGGNLVTAADMVAKSVGSSTNALTRYGIEITGAVGSSERLETAVAALNKQVGGQARAAAEVGTGALTQLKNVWGDYKEYLGSKLLPVMNKISAWGINFIEKISPKQSDALRTEQAEVNTLVTAMTSENTSREARESLITELQKKYPDFLSNLDKEKVTNEQLLTRLQDVNDAYEERIKLAVQQELVNEQAKDIVKSIKTESELLQKSARLKATLADDEWNWSKDQIAAAEGQLIYYDKKIKKEQDFRAELEKSNKEALELLGIFKKNIPTSGERGGTVPTGGGGGAGGTDDITRIAGPAKIATENLLNMGFALEEITDKTSLLLNEYTLFGMAVADTFGGLSDVIAQSFTATGDVLKNFGKFFMDFIKQMIARLVAAAIAAFTLAVAISLIPGMGAGMGAKMGKGIAFMDRFKTGFGALSGFGEGFASGGVIPGGYPGDTYPALLSSGERVLTPAQNSQYESGAMKIEVGGRVKVMGSEMWILLNRTFNDRDTNT